jgi:hypothetical protein
MDTLPDDKACTHTKVQSSRSAFTDGNKDANDSQYDAKEANGDRQMHTVCTLYSVNILIFTCWVFVSGSGTAFAPSSKGAASGKQFFRIANKRGFKIPTSSANKTSELRSQETSHISGQRSGYSPCLTVEQP